MNIVHLSLKRKIHLAQGNTRFGLSWRNAEEDALLEAFKASAFPVVPGRSSGACKQHLAKLLIAKCPTEDFPTIESLANHYGRTPAETQQAIDFAHKVKGAPRS